MLAPKLDGNIVGVIHEALLEGRQIRARYHSRKRGGEARAMELHPLGLVHRDAVAYLVATAGDYEDPRLYPLHRFSQASISEKAAKAVPGFDLDRFIDHGELGYRFGDEDIDVELLFEKEASHAIEEAPLTAAQTLTRQADGSVLVKARVPDTQVLRAWILGFGPQVEVLRPRTLRMAISSELTAAAARYAVTRARRQDTKSRGDS
jgi:predicted DNA-binding transcriptional regulator YafY